METDQPPVETSPAPEGTAQRQIARAAGIVMAGFVLSNLAGLARQILISDKFGTQGTIDAYYAAMGVPDMIFALIAGGALASAFIPTLTEFLTQNDEEGGWRLTSAVGNLLALVMLVIGAIVFVFALPIVQVFLAPKAPLEQQQLTADLLRILLISPVLLGLSGLVTGVLQANQSFVLPSFSSTLYWLGIIFGLIFFVPSMGIFGLAWGTVLGAGLHLLVQLPGLRKLPKLRYTPSLGLKDPAVRKVGRLMLPRLFGAAVVQLNFLVSINMTSGMPAGSLTAFKNAYMVMTMPQVVIAQAIAIAAFPTFSAQFARGDRDDLRGSLASTIRSIVFLSLPAALGLILLRVPVISMLFQRGEFDDRSVALTAWALLWFALGLVSHSVLEIVVRAFYAMQDTRTPVAVGVVAMGLNVVFSLTFPLWFTHMGWMPHGGLALANTAATTLEVGVLLWIIRKRLDGLEGGHVLKGVGSSVIAVVAMSAVVVWWLHVSQAFSVWWVVLGGIALGAVVYGLLLLVLRVEEVFSLYRKVLGRIRRLVQ
ncbi:murein biosynthesis integral membrane protein MurJ [bacterium]|nr:murein biosynthesis integral membrane protein MurJ [bacterium]MCB2179306.1 murein biosynthesis integral membrane protein MurJ [bacterium]